MAKRNYSSWTKEELIKELRKAEKRKKYGIVWEDRTEKVAELCKEKLPVLSEDKTREIKTDDKKPINVLIEGDNYHSLSVLNYTHMGKIDVIYIDPPYNRGSGDQFIYNDRIIDKEDSYRHSKWLSFMLKRLKLAKKLLKRSGTIFISIDDNEVAQLELLCNELFGEKNFIALIIVQTNKGGRDYLEIAKTHEYLLCYGRSTNITLNQLLKKDIGSWKLEDKKGKYEIRELRNRNPKFTKENRPNLYYPVYVNRKSCDKNNHCAISLTRSKEFSIEVYPKNSQGKDSCWRWSKKLLEKNIVQNNPEKSQVVAKQKKNNGWNVYEKSRKTTTKAKSIWDETEMRTERGTIVLRDIFHKAVFDHPKPVELIEKILKLATKKNALVLDFFAGSGTTGHAVLELNKKDRGDRQFILCTNNENNICTNTCYPRIKKVIKGYINLKKKKVKGYGGNLKYFKTDFVNAETTDRNKKKLVDKSTEMLCLKEDCFDSVKKGTHYRIFKNHQDKHLGIVYDDEGIEPLKQEIRKLNRQFIIYVFSLDESAREEEFEDIGDLVELRPIPAVILNVYRRIFK